MPLPSAVAPLGATSATMHRGSIQFWICDGQRISTSFAAQLPSTRWVQAYADYAQCSNVDGAAGLGSVPPGTVGLSAARWTAATPFLKHAGHAHGNEADLARASLATCASPRHASVLW